MTNVRDLVSLAAQSMHLDWQMLRAQAPPAAWRFRFLAEKYPALIGVMFGRPTQMDFAKSSWLIRDVSALGTMQSTILDVYEMLITRDILHRSNPVVIDAGANVGQFTNAIKLFFPDARVIAFEPDPQVFADLTHNTSSLSSIELHNVALGAKHAVLPFHRHELSGMSSFAEIADDSRRRDTLDVQVERLDDLIAESVSPDLVKIDVEGYELETVQGATQVLKRSRFLLIELGLGRSAGQNNLQVLRTINDVVPTARILRFGRPLGIPNDPECQDVLINLRGG